MAGFIDAAMDEERKRMFLSHVSGDVFALDVSKSPRGVPEIYTPHQMVIGRKADACSHMLGVGKDRLVVGRPEGIIDVVPF